MVRKALAVIAFFLLLILPTSIYAEGEFATSYDVLYDIDESGVASVTEKISLKNLTSEYYANESKLTIGASDIFDIKGVDSSGPLEIKSQTSGNATILDVKFNAQIAGLGKSLNWVLNFKSKDFAVKSGKVWEISSPKISSSSTSRLENYNLTIAVPQSFGELSAVAPPPKNQSISGGKLYLSLDKEQLKSSGISATFGTNQLFDFDLSYNLENKNLMPVLTNIALPPDTAFQDVIFQRIEPKPLNVTVDPDGNYLAWYRLKRGEKLDVRVIGSAKLYASARVKNPALSDQLWKKYTSSDKYWEKDNPQIAVKLTEILGEEPPDDPAQKAKLIYRFVVDYLKYDPQKTKQEEIERLGAVTALNNPESAVCMEFTDLFIALARAAGIPARELNGYAHTGNTVLRPAVLRENSLHSWPEYWDETRGWVMVDPTWGNTTGGVDYFDKLDLNHFVFAIRGSSSSQPVPAGSYGSGSTEGVKVTLSENDFLGKPNIDAQILLSDSIIAGFPARIKFKAVNSGNGLLQSSPLSAMAQRLSILDGSQRSSGVIPAYGEAEFEFKARTKSLFDNYEDEVTVSIAGQKYTKKVSVRPFILLRPVPMVIGAAAIVMFLIYLAVLGIHIRKNQRAKVPVKDTSKKIGKK